MDSNQQKTTLKLWFEEGWNKNQNRELANKIFSENWKDNNPIPGQPPGISGLFYRIEFFRGTFSDIRFDVNILFGESPYVVVHYTVSGVQTGEFMGIPPTNRKTSMNGIMISRFENDRIVETWTETNMLGLMQQLKASM